MKWLDECDKVDLFYLQFLGGECTLMIESTGLAEMLESFMFLSCIFLQCLVSKDFATRKENVYRFMPSKLQFNRAERFTCHRLPVRSVIERVRGKKIPFVLSRCRCKERTGNRGRQLRLETFAFTFIRERSLNRLLMKGEACSETR